MLDAKKIQQVYKDKGYKVDEEVNITYIEGLDPDGTANKRVPNHFDDLRVVWSGDKILGAWEATTRPSTYWTKHPMNPSGAFIIALGQQSCWTMGHYHDQEALIQTEPLRGTRDYNADYDRRGDREYPPGLYGVHHHWGYNYPHDDAGRSSAGCQVGRLEDGHREFISILKKDPRYEKDHAHIWTSTVISSDDYANAGKSSTTPIVGAATGAVVGFGSVIYYYWEHLSQWFHSLF